MMVLILLRRFYWLRDARKKNITYNKLIVSCLPGIKMFLRVEPLDFIIGIPVTGEVVGPLVPGVPAALV